MKKRENNILQNLWQNSRQRVEAVTKKSGNKFPKAVLVSMFFVVCLFSFTNVASAATLYWYSGGVDSNWATEGNWWTDAGHTTPGTVPTVADDVITVTGGTAPEVDLDTWTTPLSIDATNTGIVFTSAVDNGLQIDITGNVTFNGGSYNNGTVTGNATFNGTSFNNNPGIITGNATFNDTSSNQSIITGNATFNGSSENGTTVTGNATFNGTSANNGTVEGDAVFNLDSYDENFDPGTVNGATTVNGDFIIITNSWFGDDSTWLGTRTWTFEDGGEGGGSNQGTVTSDSDVVFTDDGFNTGTITGNATFNDTSSNQGTITGNATFNGTSENSGGTVTGNATFNGTSENQGTIEGDAVFNLDSYDENFDPGTVNGTITVDGDFVLAGNWSGDDSTWLGTRTWTFADGIGNNGTVTGTAMFNGSSENGGTVTGNATFNGSSLNNGGTVTGNATFNGTSLNGGTVTGNATFNGEIGENYNAGLISGNATFNGTSFNDGTVTGNGTFNEDSSEDFSTITGTKTRHYAIETTVTRDFVTDGPWVVQADGVEVDVSGATYDETTTFTTANSGCFIGGPTPVCGAEPDPTPSSSSRSRVSGSRRAVTNPPLVNTTIPDIILGCGNRATGFSATTGQSCANNIVTTTSPLVGANLDTTTLKNGSRGAVVMELQRFLNATIQGLPLLVIDGIFGPMTKSAVIAFQTTNNLTPDGIVGPITRGVINK